MTAFPHDCITVTVYQAFLTLPIANHFWIFSTLKIFSQAKKQVL